MKRPRRRAAAAAAAAISAGTVLSFAATAARAASNTGPYASVPLLNPGGSPPAGGAAIAIPPVPGAGLPAAGTNPPTPPVTATGAPSVGAATPALVVPTGVTSSGLAVGSFLLNSAAQLTEQFDSNIFATPRDRVSDYITTVTPSLDLHSTWKRHRVDLNAGGALGRYATHRGEDFNDYHVGGEGRLDLTENANLFGGTTFWHAHEPRESPDNENGIRPTTYNRVDSHVGFGGKFGAWSTRIGATRERFDYDNTPTSTGFIANQDRDRAVYEVGGRIGYGYAPEYQAFLQATHNWRAYDLRFDNFGFEHNSNGEAIAFGIAHTGSDWLTGEFFAGYLTQRYRDPVFSVLTDPDFGGRLRLRLSPVTTLSGFADRTVEETIAPGAASYLKTYASLRVDHALRRNLTINASASYENEAFHGVDRTDQVSILGAGFRYFFLPQLFIGADYQFQRRDSTFTAANYDESQVFVHLGAQLARGYDDNVPEPPQDQGFYGGIQTGHDALSTRLQGPRGGGGTLDTDFSGFGFSGGVFGGYGATIGHLYLGLEVEADGDSAKWNHAHPPNSRIFSARELYNFGATTRIGYVLDQGSLLYGRVGAAHANFLTGYQTSSGSLFTVYGHQTGIRIGGGIETPIDNRLLLRLEYTHTDYNDYDVTLPSGADNFDNSNDLVRVGLVYRLYDQTLGNQNGAPTPPTGYDGPYGGLQVGYGGLSSLNQGPRESGTSLIATRGSSGVGGGGFAGYGRTWRRFYTGAELDIGSSDQGSGQERGPDKRIYGLTKIFSLGASARLGYVLDPGALVYAKLGPVLSIFDTKYASGPDKVEQDNSEIGWRVGGGIEVPVAEKTFVRFDYAYSEYGTFKVNYHSGVDSFKNKDSLFQLGVVYRF